MTDTQILPKDTTYSIETAFQSKFLCQFNSNEIKCCSVFGEVIKAELSRAPLFCSIKDGRPQIFLAYVLNLSADPWHLSETLVEGATFLNKCNKYSVAAQIQSN